MTQSPYFTPVSIAFSATTPCPYPKEITLNLSPVIFLLVANLINPANGSAP